MIILNRILTTSSNSCSHAYRSKTGYRRSALFSYLMCLPLYVGYPYVQSIFARWILNLLKPFNLAIPSKVLKVIGVCVAVELQLCFFQSKWRIVCDIVWLIIFCSRFFIDTDWVIVRLYVMIGDYRRCDFCALHNPFPSFNYQSLIFLLVYGCQVGRIMYQ